jgi:hypothetical protein
MIAPLAPEAGKSYLRHTPQCDSAGQLGQVIHARSRGSCTPALMPSDAEYGRGLAIIAAVSDKFGHGVGVGGLTLWAEVGWVAADSSLSPTHSGGAGGVALARDSPDVAKRSS